MDSPIRSKPEPSTTPVPRRSGRFTNTGVLKFDGSVCWYQHQQVFDAIAKSNGWDDETAALQLFAHLEGDLMWPFVTSLRTWSDETNRTRPYSPRS